MPYFPPPTTGGSTPPAGSNTQIQFNDASAFGADADLTWNKTTNTLAMPGADTGINQQAITNNPSNPSTGLLRQYAKTICNRTVPFNIGPNSLAFPLQAAVWQRRVFAWFASWGGGTGQNALGGGIMAVGGSNGSPTPATTNLYTATYRVTYASVVTTPSQQIGVSGPDGDYRRGSVAGQGGFFFVCQFGIEAWTAGDRYFVGFGSTVSSLVTAQPSAGTNLCGFGIDAADTAFTFMHNDGSGAATKDTIAGQPTLAANQGYVAYIYCIPNDTVLYYRLDNFNTGAVIIDTSTSTDLPVNTTFMKVAALTSNAANTAATAAQIGVTLIYCESDL